MLLKFKKKKKSLCTHRTALHFACVYGHPEVVTLLVESSCEISPKDIKDATPLIKVCYSHQLQMIVNTLLDEEMGLGSFKRHLNAEDRGMLILKSFTICVLV